MIDFLNICLKMNKKCNKNYLKLNKLMKGH